MCQKTKTLSRSRNPHFGAMYGVPALPGGKKAIDPILFTQFFFPIHDKDKHRNRAPPSAATTVVALAAFGNRGVAGPRDSAL